LKSKTLIKKDMKAIGIILAILGVIGTVIFGYQAIQDSESFKLFGIDIAVSTANWTPVIISVAMLVIGIIMSRGK
jgi:hypothetical protein